MTKQLELFEDYPDARQTKTPRLPADDTPAAEEGAEETRGDGGAGGGAAEPTPSPTQDAEAPGPQVDTKTPGLHPQGD